MAEWLFDEHESMPFNPLIAAALYQARYVEHVGSGIEDVEAACAEAGLPQTTIGGRNRTVVHTIWRKATKETVKTSKKTTKEGEATSKKTSKKTRHVFLLPAVQRSGRRGGTQFPTEGRSRHP
jgi:predicted HTH transcriptional regulator